MTPSSAMPFGISRVFPKASRAAMESRALRKSDQRRLSRVPMALPVRVRWLGPFGLETEVSRTSNASRCGLLISSRQPRGEGSPVWVTFPYDSENETLEPEIPGRVARCQLTAEGVHAIGIRFERRRSLFMRFDRRQNPR